MTSPPHELLTIARQAIAAHLSRARYSAPALPEPWVRPTGTFVTLRQQGTGRLRGCIGNLTGTHATLASQIAYCAVQAAVHDPRFPAVRAPELDDLDLEVSLLGPEEPVVNRAELDPKRWGVVVRLGQRRGVLLPDLEGVDTVEDQLGIVLRKAGIRPDEPYSVSRFEVLKVADDDR